MVTSSIGFPPVSRPDARCLILGSLPGAESLRLGQYYAHQRNGFWRIMGALFGAGPDMPYDGRLDCLVAQQLALWDVCAAATRAGSLDAAIRSPVANDFASFFEMHPQIKRVCFNGQAAAKLFVRLVDEEALRAAHGLAFQTLPSTSPAHAAMTFERKLDLWREGVGLGMLVRLGV